MNELQVYGEADGCRPGSSPLQGKNWSFYPLTGEFQGNQKKTKTSSMQSRWSEQKYRSTSKSINAGMYEELTQLIQSTCDKYLILNKLIFA